VIVVPTVALVVCNREAADAMTSTVSEIPPTVRVKSRVSSWPTVTFCAATLAVWKPGRLTVTS